ncbi:MAG TPA: DUF2283 domain-containing protein [Solirubrobacteraceae bacterium]|jgi:uncharacterized protein YuzE|nr:DUF2283 domain-containing protein [Solirubrobacteraceae bacterium]
MNIKIAETVFNNVFYDEDADVLYLHVGDPASAVDFDESPEGHALRFDASGKLVGVTIVGAKALLHTDDEIQITLPEVVHVASGEVAPALVGV